MKRISAYNVLRGMLWGISLAAVYFIFLLNFIYNAEVSYNASEKVTISGHLFHSHLMVLLALALLLLFALLRRHLDRLDPKILFAAFCVIYIGMAVYLLVNVDHGIRADAYSVFKGALQFSEGEYSIFQPKGYIHRYPHQAGLLFYDLLLQKISPHPTVLFIANFCFVLGINLFVALIAHTLFEKRAVTNLTVLMSFAFLPQFFFILFAYGLIPGWFFMILAFYHAIKFAKTHKIHHIVLTVLGASLATCFKQNFLIGVIAILIYWGLYLFKSRDWRELCKSAIAMVALVLCMSLPSTLITLYIEQKTELELGEGTPSILWIVMGTDLDNSKRAPGWYNSYNYNTFSKAKYDTEEAARLGEEKLKENLEKIKEEPERAATFFKEKTISQWCEPMFQSVWSGPLEACKQYTHTELLQSIYNGEEAEDRIEAISKILLLLIFGFSFVFLLLYRKKIEGWELLTLFFIGGLLFHTFWEGKSQYTYPYVFCLIPLAAYGMLAISERIACSSLWKRLKREEKTSDKSNNKKSLA